MGRERSRRSAAEEGRPAAQQAPEGVVAEGPPEIGLEIDVQRLLREAKAAKTKLEGGTALEKSDVPTIAKLTVDNPRRVFEGQGAY